MHIAAMYGRTEILQELIDWGADSGATNQEGLQARDLVYQMGHSEALELCQNALLTRETAV
jgi:ankyrin repeat protein